MLALGCGLRTRDAELRIDVVAQYLAIPGLRKDMLYDVYARTLGALHTRIGALKNLEAGGQDTSELMLQLLCVRCARRPRTAAQSVLSHPTHVPTLPNMVAD